MSIDPTVRQQAFDRGLRTVTTLAQVDGLTCEDVARLVVEPVITWLGWPVTDPQRVRRGRRLGVGAPAVQVACFDRSGPILAVYTTSRLDDLGVRRFGAWADILQEAGVPTIVITDGPRWVVRLGGAPGRATMAGFECTIDDVARLGVLSRERLHRVAPASPPPPPDPSLDGELSPRPALGAGAERTGRTWDPTTYHPEVETWTKPRFVEFRGVRHPVRHWWEVVLHCAHHHLAARGRLPAYVFPQQQGPYASREEGDLRRPRLVDDGWFIETNLNAHLAHRVARKLLLDAKVQQGEILVVFE